jgi:membrane-anchored glycerophosphoryl diester phosphodiesterase (GDPDase)
MRGDGMKKALSRYLRLVVIWGITLGIALGLVRLVRYAGYLWPLRELVVWGEVAVSVLVQMLLVFALPSVVIENKKVTVSLARSLQLLRRYPLTVLLLVGIPNLLLAPFLYLQSRIPTLMQRYFPETALCVMAAYVAVIVLADFLITASSALLLLMHREAERGVMHP